MNILTALVAGIVGTIVMSMVMAVAPAMGLPKMDIVGMLGTMFSRKGNRILGWSMHLVNGSLFALIYTGLWSIGIGASTLLWGLLFAAIHWFMAGMIIGMMPALHAGIKSGAMGAPGVYMLNNGGMMAFMGGLIGHLVFGLTVALVYGTF